MDWKGDLHRELADATLLVWQMQNGLSEDMSPGELAVLADELARRAGIIQGYLSRWVFYRELQEQGKV